MRTPRLLRHGFTLIEMMIVLAIIAILAAFVYPAYTGYMVKTRRAEAAGVLQEAAMYMERLYGQARDYTQIKLPTELGQSPKSGGEAFYTNTLVTPSTRSYTLTATPSARQKDPECGNLIVDQDGTKTVSGSTDAAVAARCWGG